MIFYRLALQRIIEYLNLSRLTKKEDHQVPLHKRPRETFKTQLKTDNTLNLYISVLLSIIGILVSLSIPFAAVESPCEVFKNSNFLLYHLTKFIEKYVDVIDYFIGVFGIMLVYVCVRTVTDAVGRTKINMSPWIESGKYNMPPDSWRKRTDTIF